MRSHRPKLLSKQIHTQHPTPLVRKEHIKHTQLDHSLVRTGAQTIKNHCREPLSRTLELAKPDSGAETQDRCDQEDWATTDFHRCWNPEYVHETLAGIKRDV